MSSLHEECGVFGIFETSRTNVASSAYYALYALQHRGQESCGIVVNDDGVFHSYKDLGLVNEVFSHDVLKNIDGGNMAVGHVRYGTTETLSRENAQPLVVNHFKGSLALANNGVLSNAYELHKELSEKGSVFHTTSDAEIISYVVAEERLTAGSIEKAVCAAMNRLKGAYCLVLMSSTKLIAARDPKGIRPLCIGKTNGGYVFASESSALDAVGAEFIRDVEPGEVVVASENGLESIKDHCNNDPKALCIFEFIYFARPDSVIDGTSVHTARKRAGAFLALENPVQADVVIGVPDSGIDAAIGYANQSGIPYGLGFIKNKYIGRTFIAPEQSQRENAVRIKLNPIASTVKGKRVVMIDDSIVRGTTCARIIKLLREAGAKEVHVRVTAPPFINPCYFGTDIDSKENLIANRHTKEEIAEIIGADSLGFLSLENTKRLCDNTNFGFCTGCFDGNYNADIPEKHEKYPFEIKLHDKKN